MGIKGLLDDLEGSVPAAIILKEPNPLDPSTPTDVILEWGGEGTNGKHIDYPSVVGWDQISKTEDDHYYIVGCGDKWYVVRKSVKHERLYNENTIKYHASYNGYDDNDDDYEYEEY